MQSAVYVGVDIAKEYLDVARSTAQPAFAKGPWERPTPATRQKTSRHPKPMTEN